MLRTILLTPALASYYFLPGGPAPRSFRELEILAAFGSEDAINFSNYENIIEKGHCYQKESLF